jgi:hypothetical protein
MAGKVDTAPAPPPPPPLPQSSESEFKGDSEKISETDKTGGSGSRSFDDDLEDRFDSLNLCEEEESDLDFSGEIEELIGDVRWLAIFRVHTLKPFSHAALFKQMRNAWTPAQTVTFKEKGEKIFLAQFHCLGDWSRVMEGGPCCLEEQRW